MSFHATFSIEQSEWEDWTIEARRRGMSKSYMVRQAVNCYLNDTRGSPKMLEDILEDIKKSKDAMQNAYENLELSITEAMREEVAEKPKETIQPEVKQMIRGVRTMTAEPPIDIGPQKNKPSLDEVLAYIKSQKQCTNIEIAKHFDAKPNYIKVIVPNDYPELTIRSTEGVMTYFIGDE